MAKLFRTTSLAGRALRLAVVRIGFVALLGGVVSYFVNQSAIEESVIKQLLLSTEQTLQRESLPFKEIKDLERNFLREFQDIYTRPGHKAILVRDFDRFFYRHPDGSYTQRPDLFEGKALADGRQFAGMSATYAPDIPPNDDTKARFALSYILSHKYGSSAQGRLFNFYGVVPEKGFPIFQTSDVAQAFTYSGPDALKLETYEFYTRGFSAPDEDAFFTRMYWDVSNNAWMTTIATPDTPDTLGKHRMLACVDVLLAELMGRTARPSIQGAYSTIFLADAQGTLIYHPQFVGDIKSSEGTASIQSLRIASDYPLLQAMNALIPGKATILHTQENIIAMGMIPGTPWVLSVHYPRTLMAPDIYRNLAIVIVLGLMTLLVEVFLLRSILQKQVAIPLHRLIHATQRFGTSKERLDKDALPLESADEIGALAREFATMVERVQDGQSQLESKVQERTAELEAANRQLAELSVTDGLTGIANRRHFDRALELEWHRAQRAGTSLALAMVDVDWFKKYNDHYGHQAGDDCLRGVAQALKTQASRAGDLVARYGGEEFVFLSASTQVASALALAERLCAVVRALALSHALSPLDYVTVSVGIAVMEPAHGGSAEQLLKKADEALYQAKAQGRHQAVLAR
ncbi:diguanylate cyclase [Rhodoferax saidenbachensis]|uniref:diguanylate cyclase n=1 Tax=Rhodoferax saidenbachensis TaxID=1484693 RepID=A0ABU1ZSW5_9BURK|nr:diguanylate cyclase [Rhodoferax saidenbachensis]MDR7308646.1 diguanylate cyclase (GGDEF)-like protein [Rhodoferax saidenbachensis]